MFLVALSMLCGFFKNMASGDWYVCSVEFGRGVGYDIIEHVPPAQVGEISATKIREEMRHGK